MNAKRIKLFGQVLLLGIGVMLIFALFYGSWNRASDDSGEAIRMGLESLPLRLDPRFATDATSSRINRLLFERLVDFDETARFVPRLANWKELNACHYRFVLKADRALFHSGEKLTADDVVATYRSILNEATGSPHRASLVNIKRIEAVDAQTVDFYLHRADPMFPALLVIGILPARQIEQAQANGGIVDGFPIGSGSFAIESYADQVLLQLVRRRDSQLFEFLRVPSPEVRVLKLINGEIDLLQNDLLPELENYLTQQPQINVTRAQGTNYAYLGFNLDDPVLKDRNVRLAIAHAIDRESIIRFLYNGTAHPADALFPAYHWMANPDIKAPDYRPERARELIQRAGYSIEHPLELSFKTSTNPFSLRVMTLIQRQLMDVGIHVRLQSYDWGTFFGDIREGRFQMFSLQWVGIKTPDIFDYIFHSNSIPPNGANRGRYINYQVDDLLDKAKETQELTERIQLYQAAQKIIADDLPYISLWHVNHFAAFRDTIEGYELAADGNFDSLTQIERRSVVDLP